MKKNAQLSLAGSTVAIVTPFRDGKVDEKALKSLVKWHVRKGTSGIVPCGTTGESATLEWEEHERVFNVVVQAAQGKINVIAGTGSNNTKEAIKLTELAIKAGANGGLSVAPYYVRPTQEGLYRHFRAISESSPLPLVLYSILGRTGVNIEPETVARLACLENVVGIKEASGNVGQMSAILELTGRDFQLVSGDDALTLPVLAIGGVGIVSVLANIMPYEVARLVKYYLAGKYSLAMDLHYRLLPIVKAMFIETNPVPVKTAMVWLKMITGGVRSPLCEMSHKNAKKLREAIKTSGLVLP